MLGNRTLQNHNFNRCLKTEVVDNVTVTTKLWLLFCDGPELNATCNEYFDNNNVTLMQGIPGLKSGVISGQSSAGTSFCLCFLLNNTTSPCFFYFYFADSLSGSRS